tara:strand:+ start:1867 stop:3705 length:1839 start_codon:yes stop_codon:yes gene_type:complete
MSDDNVDRFSAVVTRNVSNISPTSVSYSITNDFVTAINNPRSDRDGPYSLTEWLVNAGESFGTPDDYITGHMQYVRTWYKASAGIKSTRLNAGINGYAKFLKEVLLVYTNQEEKRYLRNLDWSSPYDLDIAVPFFANRLREVVVYVVEQREKVRFQKTKNSFRGSVHGITKFVYDEVVQLLQSERYYLQFGNILPKARQVADDLTISIEEKFDTTISYNNSLGGDENLLERSRRTGFDLNVFVDFEQAVTNTLQSYPQLLTEDGDILIANDQQVVPNTAYTSSDINVLPTSYFSNYAKDVSTMNILQHKEWYEKYMGTDTYYLSSSTTGLITSGLLATATHKSSHHMNIDHPTVAYVPEKSNIISRRKLGGFFTKTGLSHAYSLQHSYVIEEQNIVPNTLYTFPDPGVYGSDSNIVTHSEDFRWLKADRSNDAMLGYIVDDKQMQKMYPYQSVDESNIYPKFGISRVSDNFDFWEGDERDVWANKDIYSIELSYDYSQQHDNRVDDLLLGTRAVVKYRSDIYGNDYVLLKHKPPEGASLVDTDDTCDCVVLDGEVFWDDTTWERPDYNTLVDGASGFLGYALSAYKNYVYGSYFSPYNCSCYDCYEPREEIL